MRRYCLRYVRVSGDDQVERNTPASQHQALERLASSGEVTCLGVYEDLAVSAVSVRLWDRPGWQALEKRLERGDVCEVHVMDISRLTREEGFGDVHHLHELMKRHKLQIVTVSEGSYGLNEWFDLMKLAWAGLRGGGDAAVNRQRFDAGKKRILSQRPIGGPSPLGLLWTRQQGWTLDPKWAPVIRRVFDLCVAGNSLSTISDILDGEGTPPPGAARWSVSWLAKLLHRAEYRGERTQTYKGSSGTVTVPAIVSDELWDAAQAALASRRYVPKKREEVMFLARHLLHCGTCGSRMWAQPAWGTAPGRYFCKKCSSSGAGSPYWRRDEVDAVLWELVRSTVLGANRVLEDAVRGTQDTAEADTLHETLRLARVELSGIERRRESVRRRATTGLISDDEADADLARLAAQKRAAEARVRSAEKAMRAAEDMAARRAALDQQLEALRAKVASASPAEQRELVEAVVPLGSGRIILYRSGKLEVNGVLRSMMELSSDSPAP